MNHKHIFAYIIFISLSMAHAQCYILLKGHEGRINHAEFHHNGTEIATLSDNGTVRLWNTATGDFLRQYPRTDVELEGKIHSFAFAPEGWRLATGYDDGSIHLSTFPTDNGDECYLLPAIDETAETPIAAAFKDYKTLCIANKHGSISYCNLSKKKKIWYRFHVYDGDIDEDVYDASINSLQFSPSGDYLLVTQRDQAYLVKMHPDNRTEQIKKVGLSSFDHEMIAAEFNHDETKFICTSTDGTICINGVGYIDEAEETEWSMLLKEPAISAQFSPINDQIILIASTKDNTAKLLQVDYSNREYKVIKTFAEHTGKITSARFNHDGTKFVTTSNDGTAIIEDIKG